jgi:hypothetical protein
MHTHILFLIIVCMKFFETWRAHLLSFALACEAVPHWGSMHIYGEISGGYVFSISSVKVNESWISGTWQT